MEEFHEFSIFLDIRLTTSLPWISLTTVPSTHGDLQCEKAIDVTVGPDGESSVLTAVLDSAQCTKRMRLFALVLILSLISGCLAHSVNNDLVARGTSIIPSASPSPTPDASSSWKNDKRRQWKHIHEFFKAYGWLKHNATIPDQDLPKAIRKIQKVLREPETGEYTERLEYVMSRPRCGTVQPYNETDANADSSLHSRYVLWGPKWDHTTITYRFLNYTAALPAEQQRNIVR